MNDTIEAFLPYRLVASFADGSRLLFDGITEAQAKEAMEAAQTAHGDISWWDGVTDLHYENGRYCGALPPTWEITMIDLTDCDGEGPQ